MFVRITNFWNINCNFCSVFFFFLFLFASVLLLNTILSLCFNESAIPRVPHYLVTQIIMLDLIVKDINLERLNRLAQSGVCYFITFSTLSVRGVFVLCRANESENVSPDLSEIHTFPPCVHMVWAFSIFIDAKSLGPLSQWHWFYFF